MAKEEEFNQDLELQKLQTLCDYFNQKVSVYYSVVTGILVAALIAIGATYLQGGFTTFKLLGSTFPAFIVFVFLAISLCFGLGFDRGAGYQDNILCKMDEWYALIQQKKSLKPLEVLKYEVHFPSI